MSQNNKRLTGVLLPRNTHDEVEIISDIRSNILHLGKNICVLTFSRFSVSLGLFPDIQADAAGTPISLFSIRTVSVISHCKGSE